ncbi:MAG: flagellar biosynthesis protein FliQ [Chthoniobacter sp.]|jgi:flagellar biosynthetic protein FliQ|nr:flagellar biosynthesis protein FliQ [Chthoniobacter sp.]
MNVEMAIDLLRSLITISLVLIGPIVLVSVVVGVAVSLFQAVTSIQEQTLTFVPKLVAVALLLIFAAPWMVRQMMQFTVSCFARLPEMVK